MATFSPMALGDIFDLYFKLIGKTWIRSLIVVSIIILPASLFMGFGIDSFFSALKEMTLHADENNISPESFPMEFVGYVVWYYLSLLVLLVFSLSATIGVTLIGASELEKKPMSWQEALKKAFGVRLLKVIGQILLLMLFITACVIIPAIFLGISAAADSFVFGFITGLIVIASIGFIFYAAVSFSFAPTLISWEESDVLEAFKRSWHLVSNNWWRTLGILILMSLMVSFAMSLITTPLFFIAFWDVFQVIFEKIGQSGTEKPDMTEVFQALGSVGFTIGLVIGISQILQLVVTPLYYVVMYFDLRARHGEFNRQSAAPSPQR